MSKEIASARTSDLLEILRHSQSTRRAKQKELDFMEEREKTIQAELISRKLQSGEYDGLRVTVKVENVPFGEDWSKIMQYIKDTGSVDLLEKRLLKSGVKARWDNGETVPGVVKVDKTSIKVE